MQKDLIKELCLTQGLIDIAGTGTASQSSTSKWSKENDAQRAVIGFDLLKKKIEELKAQ